MDVVTMAYALTMYNDMRYRDCQPLQIPEKAESLEEAILYDCYRCKGTFSREFVTTEYLNFSYWDGGVDIVEICNACGQGVIFGVNPREWY